MTTMINKFSTIQKYLTVFILCTLTFLSLSAQNVSLDMEKNTRGVVSDESGVPLSGATVSLLDNFKEVYTNTKGEFMIDVPVGSILYFSKQGYIPIKQEISQRGLNLAIKLLPENEEPLYQVGYGTRKRSELTTAISVIKSSDLVKSSVVAAENALAGKAAGLTVMQNMGNEPGYESTSLYIRGIGTENAMRSPYVLVDDVERSFSQLDIHEIESVTILKDGAANAQYGQRGANGTVLVTTKRGFVGKPEIDFVSQLGTQQATRLPQFLNSADYVTLHNKALQNDGLMIPSDSKNNPSMYDGSQNSLLYPDVNWYNQFLKSNAPQQQYKLMFRGGTDVIRYFMLFGYLNQQGLYKHTELNNGYSTNINYNRFNIRTNLDVDVTKSLLVSLDLSGRMENRNMPNASANDIFNTLSSIVPNAMPIQYNDTMLAGTSQFQNNPLGMISRTGYRQDRSVALQIKLKAVQNLDIITEGLKAEAAFGYDGNSSYGLCKSQDYATYEFASGNAYVKYGDDMPLSLNMSATNQGYYYLLSFYGGFNYNRVFENKHGVNGDIRYYQTRTFVRGDNLPYGKQGINGRAGYNFDKRYFLDFTFSYDGSDEFSKGNRFGFFPGVSGAWLISNEQFLKNNPVISFLKLRASYGEAGNCKTSGFDRYAYQSHWYAFDASSGGYIFGSGFGWSDGAWEGRIPNPDLTWETTRNYNVGVDVSLYDKLSLNIDGFIHNRDNIILELVNTIPSVVGAPSPYANAGAVLNRGFETSLVYQDQIDKVGFYLQGNVSFARNEITKTDEIANLADNLKRTGRSVTQPFGMLAIGYYNSQEDIDNSPYNSLYKVRPGDIKYMDVNHDEIINSQDEVPVGSPLIPEWTFGLSAGLDYKGFDFSFLLSAYTGRTVYLNNKSVWLLRDNGNTTALAFGAWEAGVREESATYPRLTTEQNQNNFRSSSYWLKRGDFLRLSNIEIGYSLPHVLLSKLKIRDIRLYANGQNLFSLDYLAGYNLDPEVVDAGVTGYPVMKVFNLGLSVKF